MVYVTGDTHIPIDIKKLNTRQFPEQKTLNRNDFVIICGDFGAVWDNSRQDRYWRKWLEDKPFTTLFVDGNHENFNILNEMPVIEFSGGKAHLVMPHVIHLMRGEIYTIDGHTYFCMGGAASHDKHLRKQNVDWWAEEMPTRQEMSHAVASLERVGWSVDYIISHCASKSKQNEIAYWYENDGLTSFLQFVQDNCKYSHWYFAHYHKDMDLDEKHHALYQRVVPIAEV